MAVITIGGGRGGFAEYMENGRKQGRDFHRNTLDDRVWLHGDLQVFESVVNGMERKGEKYLHGTISFAEDSISEDTLRGVFNDIKEFFGAGCADDEMMFYAEAHLPKIKSYVSKEAGEVVQRKPHIHFAIPKINLLTGQTMDPLRMVRMQLSYIDALQEKINAKYGLRSPKESPRLFKDASEIVGRLGGDMFVPVGRSLKQEILTQVIEQKIESREAFEALLKTYGDARPRNRGKHTEHFYVKPGPDANGKQRNGTNLRDPWFRPDFIALPTAEKVAQLQADTSEWQQAYIEARAALATPEVYERELQEWFATRARENIRLNSGDRKQWAAYQLASPEEKIAILDRLDAEFLEKHTQESDHEPHRRAGDRGEPGHYFGHSPQPHPGAAGPRTLSGHRMHKLSERGLARLQREDEAVAVLPGDAHRDRRGPDGLRRESEPVTAEPPTGQPADEADKLEALRASGEQIIEAPAAVLEALTRTQSVFTRRELEKHLREHTADEAQYARAYAAVMASPELLGLQGEDKARGGREGRIAGEFIARGAAPFEHQQDGSPSYFVRYRDADGELREVWGIGLRAAMDRLNPAAGDRIALTNQGRTEVTVREPVRDTNGRITGYREKAAHRNTWLAEAAPLERSGHLFTTREVRAIETRLLERTERLASGKGPALSAESRAFAADKRTMNEGQAAAFELLTSGTQLAIVNGAAGTGKSYVLAAMREAYEREGYTLHGAILQGKGAEDLERDSGIKCQTMHGMLPKLRKGTLKLDSKSVLVVDEAGMIGSRQMEELLSFAEQAGARVRLVGDAKQLHAVDYGNAFAHMSKLAEVRSLTEIQRQRHDWMREASMALSRHEIAPAIKAYAERGMVHQYANQEAATLALVERWNADRLSDRSKSQIVLTRTNPERRALNDMMRDKLKESGDLGAEATVRTESGKLQLAEGDRIVFLKNEYKTLNVRNGTAAVVERIEGDTLTVRLQDGRSVAVDLNTYGHIDHGYAMTVHKSQGMTVDWAYSLVSPGMSAENAYVAWTRHKEALVVCYAEDKFKSIEALTKRLSNAERKEFSPEYELAESAAGASMLRMLGLDESGQIVRPVAQPGDAIGAALREITERRAVELAERQADFTEIKKNLDASRLLAYLQREKGLVASKYEIVKAKDGSDRIVCGSSKYTVNDFVRDEMGLSWHEEAAPILLAVYDEQQRELGHNLQAEPDKGLWRDFQAWRANDWQAAQEAQRLSERDRMDDINEAFETQRTRLGALHDAGKHGEHRAMLSIARMERALSEQALRREIEAERRALDRRERTPTGEQFREWLAEQAQKGNERALAELRRQALPVADELREVARIAAPEARAAAQSAPVLPGFAYRVDGSGNVTYTRDGHEVMRDERRSISVIEQSADTIETALRMARQRFGPELTVTGTDEFKELVATVAASRNLAVRFVDPAMNERVKQLQSTLTQPTPAAALAPIKTPEAAGDMFAQLSKNEDDIRKAVEREAERERQRRAELEQQRELSRDDGDELDMN